MNGTVIAVEHSGDAETQKVAYNGHKREQCSKIKLSRLLTGEYCMTFVILGAIGMTGRFMKGMELMRC